MLPLQLLVGLVLGFALVRRTTNLVVVVGVGALAAVAWGVLIALSVRDSGDSDGWAGFAGGTALAAINVIVGLAIGALIAWTISRGDRRTRRPSR